MAAVGLTAAELARLPELLRNARAVLLDARDSALLFIGRASDRRESSKVVVRVNFRLKLGSGKEVANVFRTATLTDPRKDAVVRRRVEASGHRADTCFPHVGEAGGRSWQGT